MAFTDATLSKMSVMGQNLSLWCYDTLDASATVFASGYFTGNAVVKIKVGDLVLRRTWATAISGATGTISTWGIHICLTNDGTTVDLSDPLVGIVANT